MKPPRIVTFGSCLSRYTANHYVALFDGRVVSSTYHNRSDAFRGRFVDGDWPLLDHASLSDRVEAGGDADDHALTILRNQCPEWMGQHRLSQGIPLLQLLDRGSADLVIADNYMDVSARLLSRRDDERVQIFLRPSHFAGDEGIHWRLGDFQEPGSAARDMTTILQWMRLRWPQAALVFLCFPHNTYSTDPARIERSLAYEAALTVEGGLKVPSLTVAPRFQTAQRQHFKPPQYAAYAGIVHQHLRQRASTR